MAAVRGGAQIKLCGPPHKAAAVVQLDPSGDTVVPITVNLSGGKAVFPAYATPFGKGTSQLRLELPRETPPGTYLGEGSIGGKRLGVVVEVESVIKLKVLPRRVTLAAEPGSRKDLTVTIANGGNVPFEVPKASSFDLDVAEGYGRALGRSLRAKLEQGEHRVDRLFEEIRAGHGGEARVTVKEAAPIAPGESRVVTGLLEIPAALQPGRTYRGTWVLGNVSHPVSIEAKKSGTPSKPRTIG